MNKEETENLLWNILARLNDLEGRFRALEANTPYATKEELHEILSKTENFFNGSVLLTLTEIRDDYYKTKSDLTRLATIIEEDLPPDNRLYLELYKMGLIKGKDEE